MDSTLMFALFIAITAMGMIFYQATILAERFLLRRWNFGSER